MTDQVKEVVEALQAEEALAEATVIPEGNQKPNGDTNGLSSQAEAPETGAITADHSAETATTPERDRMSEHDETTEQTDEQEHEQQPQETAPERDETTEAADESTSTDADETATSTQEEDTESADGTDWEAEAKKYKALLRKQEERAKTNFRQLEKAKAEGTATKAELDALAARVKAAEEKAEASERKALIAVVAEEAGLTTEQAGRLRGKTKEALLNDAAKIKALFGLDKTPASETDSTPETKKPSGRPKEKLRGGASSEDDGPSDEEIVDSVMKKAYGHR